MDNRLRAEVESVMGAACSSVVIAVGVMSGGVTMLLCGHLMIGRCIFMDLDKH
jgi:hypothetical protein